MTQSVKHIFSLKVHLLGGSLLGSAFAVLAALLVRCHRESVPLSSVLNLWVSLNTVDEPLPGADLARVELLSNAAMLALLGVGAYSFALLGRSLNVQSLRSHSNPRMTLRRVRFFAWSLIGMGLLNLALATWMIASVQHLGVNIPHALAEWARGFEVDKTYEPREVLSGVAMSGVFARLVTAAFLFVVSVLILRRDMAIRRELHRLAC